MADKRKIVIVGAGVAGLASAIRLSHAGHDVHVFDAATGPGGKMRTRRSSAGLVDIGPTVLTMRWVFEDLFASVGADLSDHVTLTADTILARHWWMDGSTIDLHSDPDLSAAAVRDFAGTKAANQYRAFSRKTAKMFTAFKGPMMETAKPSIAALTAQVLSQPSLIPAMAPWATMAKSLAADFDDPRLRQLFGRYATYVGGSPFASPALLSLIAHSEALGVWSVKGGMNQLANAMEQLAKSLGATFTYGTPVQRIITNDGSAVGVQTADGPEHADLIVFNGDPAALQTGLMGDAVTRAVSKDAVTPRSLSAWVWGFAAKPSLSTLTHHNVFFGNDPADEFGPIDKGHIPHDPTLYICAQDRGAGAIPSGEERFEIIMNGAPTTATTDTKGDRDLCHQTTFDRLTQFGLTFDQTPQDKHLTSPADWNRLFPASQGSLYGRSPHGMTASLKRPTARTRVKGLYLAGGGAHPGAGVPMATLSALHVAATIKADLISTLPSRRTGMRGGTSTA